MHLNEGSCLGCLGCKARNPNGELTEQERVDWQNLVITRFCQSHRARRLNGVLDDFGNAVSPKGRAAHRLAGSASSSVVAPRRRPRQT